MIASTMTDQNVSLTHHVRGNKRKLRESNHYERTIMISHTTTTITFRLMAFFCSCCCSLHRHIPSLSAWQIRQLPTSHTFLHEQVHHQHRLPLSRHKQGRCHEGINPVLFSSSDNIQDLPFSPQQRQQDEDENNISSASTGTTGNTSTLIPANLRRKIQAKRPTLGHVVPEKYKKQQQQQQQQISASGGSIPSQLRYQGKREVVVVSGENNNKSLIKIMAGVARGRKLESPSTVYLRPMMGKVKEAVYSTLTSFGLYDDTVNLRRTTNTASIPKQQEIRHLDIFAGSGSVGLESLSRGATHCTFVDFSNDCCSCIQRNIDLTGLGTTTTTSSIGSSSNRNSDNTNLSQKSSIICCTDAMMALTDPYTVGIPSGSTYHIITICPPYEEVVYGDLLEAVVGSDVVMDDTIVIIEYPIELLQQQSSTKNTVNNKSNSCTMPHVIQCKSNTAIGLRNRKYGRTVMAFYIINPTGRYPNADSRPEEFVQPV